MKNQIESHFIRVAVAIKVAYIQYSFECSKNFIFQKENMILNNSNILESGNITNNVRKIIYY